MWIFSDVIQTELSKWQSIFSCIFFSDLVKHFVQLRCLFWTLSSRTGSPLHFSLRRTVQVGPWGSGSKKASSCRWFCLSDIPTNRGEKQPAVSRTARLTHMREEDDQGPRDRKIKTGEGQVWWWGHRERGRLRAKRERESTGIQFISLAKLRRLLNVVPCVNMKKCAS